MKKIISTITVLLSLPCLILLGNPVPPTKTGSVEWVSVKTAHKGEGAYLHWITGKEVNTHFFEVERSFDGYVFEKVAEVYSTPREISTHFYQYLDPNLQNIPASKIFYRLRQVNGEGKGSFSPVVELVIRPEEAIQFVSGKFNAEKQVLDIHYQATEASELLIVNEVGTPVYLKEVEAQTQEHMQLTISNWEIGTYFLVLRQEENQVQFKVSIEDHFLEN